MWHVVFAGPGRLPQSRAARSRDAYRFKIWPQESRDVGRGIEAGVEHCGPLRIQIVALQRIPAQIIGLAAAAGLRSWCL
jgi:hypothetical protein